MKYFRKLVYAKRTKGILKVVLNLKRLIRNSIQWKSRTTQLKKCENKLLKQNLLCRRFYNNWKKELLNNAYKAHTVPCRVHYEPYNERYTVRSSTLTLRGRSIIFIVDMTKKFEKRIPIEIISNSYIFLSYDSHDQHAKTLATRMCSMIYNDFRPCR